MRWDGKVVLVGSRRLRRICSIDCFENGKFITEDGTDNYNFDNLKYEVSELKNPFGSYRLKVYQSPATQCGAFEKVDQYEEFKKKRKIGEIVVEDRPVLIDTNLMHGVQILEAPRCAWVTRWNNIPVHHDFYTWKARVERILS